MTERHHTGRTVGIAAALFAVSVWAGWIPVTRLGVVTSLSAWDVAALRFATAGLVLAPVLALRWRRVPWGRIGPLAALLAGAGVPYLLAFGYGLRVANSGQGAVLGPGANSALVAVLALAVLGEKPSRGRLLGLAITLGGVAIVILHDLALGGVRVGGFALILCASTLWATYTVASRVLHLDPVTNVAVVSVGNAVLYLPFYLASGGFARLAAAPPADLWLQAIFQGVITSVLALLAYAFAVHRLGPTFASSFTPLSPVLAATFGFLLLGDVVDAATAFGLAMVAVGVVVASRAPASRPTVESAAS
jgi:drug/metabolite transporter (DMT)-like permease